MFRKITMAFKRRLGNRRQRAIYPTSDPTRMSNYQWQTMSLSGVFSYE